MKTKIIFTFYIVFLFAAAIILRFYNINWDQGNFFHPDERNIDNAVAAIHFFDKLNPHFFAYGGFSIYLYRAAAEILAYFTKDQSWTSSWNQINIIGRTFSAFFSTITLIPLFLLARKITKSFPFSIFVIFLYTFSPTAIQYAHFSVTESLLVFEVTTITLFSLYLLDEKKNKFLTSLSLGVLSGIAVATKTTSALFLLIPCIAYLLLLKKFTPMKKLFSYFFLFASLSALFFFLFSPFTILDFKNFSDSMHYESGVAIGSIIVPYTYQFTNTYPYVFQLENFLWQFGIASLFLIPGYILLIKNMLTKKTFSLLIFLTFPLVYFLYVGAWHTKFLRYMLPITPFILISCVYFLQQLYNSYKKIGIVIITLLIITSTLWGIAFFSIYTHPQTRITASEWIYTHIPAGSSILQEHWDDGLPIPLPAFDFYPNIYYISQLTVYDNENNYKANYYASMLSNADYVVINSRRLYGTLMYLPTLFPTTSTYYKDLFAGKLGYEKIAQFTSYPSLLGFSINDDGSEETFQVYDHPKVLIFKNTKRLSSQEILSILTRN